MIYAHFFVANTINAGFLLQKWFQHTCFVAKTIYTHFLCHKNALFCYKKNLLILFGRENDLRAFLSRKRFTHFVRKVFARWKLPSGKFRLFGPLHVLQMVQVFMVVKVVQGVQIVQMISLNDLHPQNMWSNGQNHHIIVKSWDVKLAP